MVTEPETVPAKALPPLTVLYDGACPLCRREIGIYRGLQAETPVCFADVSDASLLLPPGTTREQLLARFHVRGRDGELLSGARAFLALWAALPGWRWLALLGRVPGAAGLMERGYRFFLGFRPTLQRWALLLDRPGAEQTVPIQPGAHDDAPADLPRFILRAHPMIAIALIIDASGGIGRALARQLHARICRLAVLAIATCHEAFGAAPRPLMRHRERASMPLLGA